MVVSVLEW